MSLQLPRSYHFQGCTDRRRTTDSIQMLQSSRIPHNITPQASPHKSDNQHGSHTLQEMPTIAVQCRYASEAANRQHVACFRSTNLNLNRFGLPHEAAWWKLALNLLQPLYPCFQSCPAISHLKRTLFPLTIPLKSLPPPSPKYSSKTTLPQPSQQPRLQIRWLDKAHETTFRPLSLAIVRNISSY
jgi:hypothetical protein